jgi:hypothetical protein
MKLRGWANSLQNSNIPGQRHLNDQSRRVYEKNNVALNLPIGSGKWPNRLIRSEKQIVSGKWTSANPAFVTPRVPDHFNFKLKIQWLELQISHKAAVTCETH